MTAATPNAYLRTKVLTANPAELRLMLLDGAIRFARQAQEGLAARNFEACYNGTTRCQNIVLELLNGLRPEHNPEVCEKLSALYTYLYTQLLRASTERDSSLFDEVLKLLEYERETWALLMAQLQEQGGHEAVDSPPREAPAHAGLNAPVGAAGAGGTLSLRG